MTTPPSQSGKPNLLKSLARATILVGSVQASIKFLGFLEKVVLSDIYGTDSPTYAAYLVAFEVLLVASEVLKLSVIPTLVPALERCSREESDLAARRLTSRFATVVVLAVGALLVLPALILADPLLRASFAGGWLTDPVRRRYVPLMVAFFRVLVGGAVFTTAGVCTYALLNHYRRFGLAALGDLTFKLIALGSFLVVGFAIGPPQRAVFGLVGGVFAGCAGYLTVHLIGLERMGKLEALGPSLAPRDHRLHHTLLLFTPLLLSMLLFNSRRILDKLLASRMELADYVAAQDFAFRFVETPYRFLIEPFAIVLLPHLAGLAAEGERSRLREAALGGMRALLVVFLPASLALYLLRRPLIQLTLEHGRFDIVSTHLTCGALRWYILALTFWGMDMLLRRTCFALQRTLAPAVFESAAMGLYLLLALHWRQGLRHEGLALAFALSRLLKVGLLLVFLRPKLGGLDARRNLSFLARLFLAAGGMGTVIFGTAHLLEAPREAQIWVEAEGERLVYTLATGTKRTGWELARKSTTVTLSSEAATSAELSFVVPETGHYRLWLRIGSQPGAPPTALEVQLAGQRFVTPSPDRLNWLPIADHLQLTAGLHRLKIALGTQTPGKVEFDAMVLANNVGSLAGFSPEGAARPKVGRTGLHALGPPNARPRNIATLLIATVLGCAVYLLALRLLKTEELAAARSIFRRSSSRS